MESRWSGWSQDGVEARMSLIRHDDDDNKVKVGIDLKISLYFFVILHLKTISFDLFMFVTLLEYNHDDDDVMIR